MSSSMNIPAALTTAGLAFACPTGLPGPHNKVGLITRPDSMETPAPFHSLMVTLRYIAGLKRLQQDEIISPHGQLICPKLTMVARQVIEMFGGSPNTHLTWIAV